MSNVTDPIADMLTRIRNALMADHKEVLIPASKVKIGIADVLKREGYIQDYEVIPDNKQGNIRIIFKRNPNPLVALVRVSKPGRRIYVSAKKIPRVKGGLGICILSTSMGILSDNEARKKNVGGELLAMVW